MKKIFLTCIHDRHTDDKFLAFTSELSAKSYLRGIQKAYRWEDAEINEQYGDWCIYISDDYYLSVEEIELVSSAPLEN